MCALWQPRGRRVSARRVGGVDRASRVACRLHEPFPVAAGSPAGVPPAPWAGAVLPARSAGSGTRGRPR